MKKGMQLVIVVVLATLLVCGASPAGAQDRVAVSIDAPAETEPDSDLTAIVSISNVAAFDAGQFDVSFDESVIRLDNVTGGLVHTTEIPVAVRNKVGQGMYRIVVNVPGVPGVAGSGSLATLRFRAIGSAGDTTSIDLSNGFLNNSSGKEITATWTGGLITLYGGADNQASSVPTLLATALLGPVLVGLAGYALLQRRKAHRA